MEAGDGFVSVLEHECSDVSPVSMFKCDDFVVDAMVSCDHVDDISFGVDILTSGVRGWFSEIEDDGFSYSERMGSFSEGSFLCRLNWQAK